MKKKWKLGTKDSFKKDINGKITSEINITDYALLSEGTIPDSSMSMLEYWDTITSPTTNTINAIFMLSDTKGWAVGDNGTILKYDNGQWILENSPTSNKLRSIYMLSETSGWAVGDYGDDGQNIWRYDNGIWQAFPSPDVINKYGIFMVSETDGWIVGTGGHIYKYNGGSWNIFTSPITAYLNSVFMVSGGTDGWIVGAGTILRWDNIQSQWIPQNVPYAAKGKALYSVYMVSANYGWIVGQAKDAYDGGIFKWDGTTWFESNNPLQLIAYYYSVYAKSENEAWAVDRNGAIVKWDGVQWRVSPSSYQIGLTDSLKAISMSSSSKGFIVGSGGKIAKPVKGNWINNHKDLLHEEYFDVNSDWQQGTSSDLWNAYQDLIISRSKWYGYSSAYVINGIAMYSATLGFLVGNQGLILKWDGTNLIPQSAITTENLFDVCFFSESLAFAVGTTGKILKWSNNAWSIVIPITTNTLNCICATSPTDGWIGGQSTLIKGSNMGTPAETWAIQTFPLSGGSTITSITSLSTIEVWATGGWGMIIKWNGSQWVMIKPAFFFGTFLGFAIRVKNTANGIRGWLTGLSYGSPGVIVQFDGIDWFPVYSPSNHLNAICIDTSTDMADKIVGNNGTILKYNKQQAAWEIDTTSPTTQSLWDITYIDTIDEYWAVGQLVILRTGYVPTGNWQYTLDCSDNLIAYDKINYTVTLNGQSVTCNVQSSPDQNIWSAVETIVSDNIPQTTPLQRYLRVILTLSTSDYLISPVVNDLRIKWKHPEDVTLNLGQSRQTDLIKLYSENLKSFKLLSSIDGNIWTEVRAVTNNIYSYKSFDFTAFNCNYLKLIITALQNDIDYAQVSGLEIYDTESNPNVQPLEHNPQSQEETIPSGEIVTTISGLPRKIMSTIPSKVISISGAKIGETTKEFLEKLQKVNSNLILVISTLYGEEKIYEVIPGSLKVTRRKTIPFEEEPSYSYQYEFQLVKQWS